MRRAHKIWAFYNLERRRGVVLLYATITGKRMLRETVAEFILELPYSYPSPEPGQFVRVKCDGFLLPRPISICWSNWNEKPEMCLIVESRGSGTEWLVSQEPGVKIDLSIPLGNGFKIHSSKKYLIVGGGIGIAPLFSVFEKNVWDVSSILCFTTREKLMMHKTWLHSCPHNKGNDTSIATDDGSYGLKGRADEILRDHLKSISCDYDAILTCGPKPMIVAVSKIAEEFNIPCQVSLEEYMACGVGACKGCAVTLITDSGVIMGTVCKDGPVFNSKEVLWDGKS